DAACHVELEARLSEWEVARANAHLALDPIQRLDHVQQRALHVSDGQRLVDSQAFDLAEVGEPRGFQGVAAVDAAWRDDVDRRLLDTLHRPDLNGRRVRPEQKLRREVERVPALPRRMAGGEVEGLEVVPLGLDLRAVLDLVSQTLEHGLDLPADLREDMDVAAPNRQARGHDVDRLGLRAV